MSIFSGVLTHRACLLNAQADANLVPETDIVLVSLKVSVVGFNNSALERISN